MIGGIANPHGATLYSAAIYLVPSRNFAYGVMRLS